MTDDPLATLEALLKEATPGPWHFVEENTGLMPDHGYGLLYGQPDAFGWEKNLFISVGASNRARRELGEGAPDANAALIAHLRNLASAPPSAPWR